MIIFLYGPDTYRSRQKLNEIIEHYKKTRQSGLNLKCFDFRKNNYQDFQDEIRSISIFKEKKLAVLRNNFLNNEFKEKFLKDSKKYIDLKDIILFYEQEKINQRNSLFTFLKKNAESQEFKLLEGQKLKSWVKKEFEKYKTEIEPNVSEALIEYIGSDLWQMSNEIKKLASFKKNSRVKLEDVNLLVRPKVETDIFKTIDAVSQKNKKQALKLLHKHLEKGDPPLYLLSMINFQFRNLLIVKELVEKGDAYNVILKKSGLHPFVAKKSYFQSQKFTFQELKKIFQKIFQIDLDIKTGRVEPGVALDILIAEL